MSIASLTSGSYYSLGNLYKSLSTGKRINSAADDAAGLAVANSMKTQITGYSVQNSNAKDEQNALNIQDGQLDTVTSSLQRMRQLASQATNGTYSAADRSYIQSEIDQLKDFIGSDRLNELGLTDFSVTSGDFSLSDIDDAINSVSSMRGSIGAQSNALDHMMNANSIAEENLTDSLSQIEDLDYASMINRLKTEQTLLQVRMAMQKNSMSNDMSAAKQLLGIFSA